jgi:hypothetical protein
LEADFEAVNLHERQVVFELLSEEGKLAVLEHGGVNGKQWSSFPSLVLLLWQIDFYVLCGALNSLSN